MIFESDEDSDFEFKPYFDSDLCFEFDSDSDSEYDMGLTPTLRSISISSSFSISTPISNVSSYVFEERRFAGRYLGSGSFFKAWAG